MGLDFDYDDSLLIIDKTCPIPSLLKLTADNLHKRVAIYLVEASARTRLYTSVLKNTILRPPEAPISIFIYRDVEPWSGPFGVVETVFIGDDFQGLKDAILRTNFTGGSAMRNALHKGMSSVLELHNLLERIFTCAFKTELHLVCTTLPYEFFYSSVPTPPPSQSPQESHDNLLRKCLAKCKRKKFKIVFYLAEKASQECILSILREVVASEGEGVADEMGKWIKVGNLSSSSSWKVISYSETGHSPTLSAATVTTKTNSDDGQSSNGGGRVGGTVTEHERQLEVAVREFLTNLVKLPQNKRSEAVKKQLESPAYSAQYKQVLLRMMKKLQNQATTNSANTPSVTAQSTLPSAPTHTPAPLLNTRLGSSAIWRGRMTFKSPAQYEMSFDCIATPLSNPKSIMPNIIPNITEYFVESWPLVLSVPSFLPIRAPAVTKSVPISRLVELSPINEDDLKTLNICRNILISGHLVGLVRLSSSLAMLVAARPQQQLVGMVLSKAAMNEIRQSTAAAHPQQHGHYTRSQAQRQSAPMAQSVSTATGAHLTAHRSNMMMGDMRMTDLITPEAILRQQRPPSAPSATYPMVEETNLPENTSNNLDLFNALMNNDTEWGIDQIPKDSSHNHHDYLDFL